MKNIASILIITITTLVASTPKYWYAGEDILSIAIRFLPLAPAVKSERPAFTDVPENPDQAQTIRDLRLVCSQFRNCIDTLYPIWVKPLRDLRLVCSQFRNCIDTLYPIWVKPLAQEHTLLARHLSVVTRPGGTPTKEVSVLAVGHIYLLWHKSAHSSFGEVAKIGGNRKRWHQMSETSDSVLIHYDYDTFLNTPCRIKWLPIQGDCLREDLAHSISTGRLLDFTQYAWDQEKYWEQTTKPQTSTLFFYNGNDLCSVRMKLGAEGEEEIRCYPLFTEPILVRVCNGRLCLEAPYKIDFLILNAGYLYLYQGSARVFAKMTPTPHPHQLRVFDVQNPSDMREIPQENAVLYPYTGERAWNPETWEVATAVLQQQMLFVSIREKIYVYSLADPSHPHCIVQSQLEDAIDTMAAHPHGMLLIVDKAGYITTIVPDAHIPEGYRFLNKVMWPTKMKNRCDQCFVTDPATMVLRRGHDIESYAFRLIKSELRTPLLNAPS